MPEVTHISYPFPSNALAVFDGANVEVTYFKHPQDTESAVVTGDLIAVNGSGVIVQLSSGKHIWIHFNHLVGMEEQ